MPWGIPKLAKNKSPNGASSLPSRSDVASKHQWKTEHIFSSDKYWDDAYTNVENLLSGLEHFQGKLGESAKTLLDCLELNDQIDELIGKIYLYAGLKNDEDTSNPKYQVLRDKAASLLTQIKEKNSFFQPEILSIPEEKLWSLVGSNSKLKTYRHYLKDLVRLRPHVLPKEQEKLLAMSGEIGDGPYNIFSMFNNADIKFPTIVDEKNNKIEVTKGRYNKLMQSPEQKTRKDAHQAFYGTYRNWTNTLAATLSTAIKKNIFNAKARDYPNALEAALYAENIPTSVYDNVVDSVNKNLKPLHRYMELRKKMLGLDKLNPWDLLVPLVKDIKFEIPYHESLQTIEKALQPLGKEYLSAQKEGFKSGWIDIYENRGKRSGAYSWSTHGVHPFILLNYNDTVDDMFTVAHEMGHALHSYFTHRTQPIVYSGYTIFVAEVASTLNEALLIDYLLKNTEDERKKLYLINEYLDQIRGTVYTQALFAEFEKHIHELVESGQPLTAPLLNQINRDLYERYFGPALALDPLYEINWCRIPHYYYNFYVYKYVTGFSAAISISRKILAGEMNARDAYLNFLTKGSSDYSINLLKDAGVDMTSPEPIEATTRLMSDLLNQMEEIHNTL